MKFVLTEAHAEIAKTVLKEWGDLPEPTSLAGRAIAQVEIESLYTLRGFARPTVIWKSSIPEAIKYIVKKYLDGDAPHPWDYAELWGAAYFRSDDRIELATLDFYTRIGLLEEPAILPLLAIAKRVDVWWALRDEAVVVGNFARITRDSLDRASNLSGPAIHYADGHEIFAIENCRVPKHVVTDPNQIQISEIKALTSSEVRRIWIRQMGIRRYLLETMAETVDVDGGLPGPGGAPRALLKDTFGDKWLLVTDGSTDRLYYLPVPRASATCREAHQWISGLADESCITGEC